MKNWIVQVFSCMIKLLKALSYTSMHSIISFWVAFLSGRCRSNLLTVRTQSTRWCAAPPAGIPQYTACCCCHGNPCLTPRASEGRSTSRETLRSRCKIEKLLSCLTRLLNARDGESELFITAKCLSGEGCNVPLWLCSASQEEGQRQEGRQGQITNTGEWTHHRWVHQGPGTQAEVGWRWCDIKIICPLRLVSSQFLVCLIIF